MADEGGEAVKMNRETNGIPVDHPFNIIIWNLIYFFACYGRFIFLFCLCLVSFTIKIYFREIRGGRSLIEHKWGWQERWISHVFLKTLLWESRTQGITTQINTRGIESCKVEKDELYEDADHPFLSGSVINYWRLWAAAAEWGLMSFQTIYYLMAPSGSVLWHFL